jgi:hypothetical protein
MRNNVLGNEFVFFIFSPCDARDSGPMMANCHAHAWPGKNPT